ncbi:MAG: class I SAM-dependent methyltransferase [Rhizobiaceae bacterium]
MVQQIFDRQAIKRNRQRALSRSDGKSLFLLSHVAAEMADRLNFVDRKFERAAITSGNSGLIDAAFLAGTRHTAAIFPFDPGKKADWLTASEEQLEPHYQELDLALSFLSLHETNDTPGALVQIRRALRPDGLFMGVMPASNTLAELRECLTLAEAEIAGGASPRIHPFMDVRTAGELLQRAGFALPVVDEETITVRYPDMVALMRELRAMGAANALDARSRKPSSRAMFARAAQIYQERFGAPDGRIPATFTFVWMSGWAPSESQQKPARRGSATASLEIALKDIESSR